tara:strand:+ start:286 stop:522 length:237 start_codon:yes stop_codon:yes gene_type:complete
MPYDKEGVSNVAVPTPLSKPSAPLRNMFELTKLTTFEPLGIKLAGSEFIYSSCEKIILLISKKNIKIKFFNYSESGSR